MGREVEGLFVGNDRLPREETSHSLVQILKARPVDRQEYQRVAVQARRVASRLENGPGGGERGAVGVFAMGLIDPEHHKPGIQVVRHILHRSGHGMHPAEVALLAQVFPKTPVQLSRDSVRIAPQLLGPVFSQLGHCGLSGIPVSGAVLVQVRCRGGQTAQGVSEHRGSLARHDAAQLDSPILYAPVGGSGRRSRPEVDRTSSAAAGRELAQVRQLAI
ncbi:MAG: hypothetical protein BWY92_01541 [Firmicutes bacterium ADurb.BinA052]|nr:MAG: hypothetical protein BWY92_01541 [Firmicutes bacterium ADurb.BinA052]